MILDGTVVRTNRIRAHNRAYYSGKHSYHGVNLQGLMDPWGNCSGSSTACRGRSTISRPPGRTADRLPGRFTDLPPITFPADRQG